MTIKSDDSLASMAPLDSNAVCCKCIYDIDNIDTYIIIIKFDAVKSR